MWRNFWINYTKQEVWENVKSTRLYIQFYLFFLFLIDSFRHRHASHFMQEHIASIYDPIIKRCFLIENERKWKKKKTLKLSNLAQLSFKEAIEAVFFLAMMASAGFDFLGLTEQRAFGTGVWSATGQRETPAWRRRDKFTIRSHSRGGDGKIKEEPPVPFGFSPPKPYFFLRLTQNMTRII